MALLASTGLSAVLIAPGAPRAQTAPPAANATPQGGVVVGGSSTITQSPGNTTVNQATQRTAINWQSFNVGSQAQVQFNQPSSTAIALNRVVGGNLSQINGKINANGQLVLINQSGVVFGKGSQVNAESVVVATANIATKDFMAGRMVFSGAPNPGAKIINNGNITARDAGLVGLVAPQVLNDGIITARLGQVVLAGATAFTLDLYGDRLISLDVTQAVRAVDVGGKLVPALVTNSGVIIADGGHITLTAQDADALVTQLINAGGTIRAGSVGSQTGTISVEGIGGNIQIAGNLLARGTAAGSKGGSIEALTDGTVAVAPGAIVDASGDAGGGVIAIGTNLARALTGASGTTAPKAAAVTIAQGAALKADATGKGDGGTITLLSQQKTGFAGTLSAQGGPDGGNGGLAEISSDGVISLSGTVLDTAINGQAGEILLDPQTLVVTLGGGTPDAPTVGTGPVIIGDFTATTQTSYVDTNQLDSLSGNIVLKATKLVSVASAVSLSTAGTSLSIVSQGDVSITNVITVNGSLEIDAANSISIGSGGGLTIGGNILLNGTTGIGIAAPVTATGVLALESGGTITEGATGTISTPTLISIGTIGGDVSLAGKNAIGTLAGFTLAGDLLLHNTIGLDITGSVAANDVSLSVPALTLSADVTANGTTLSPTGTLAPTIALAADTLTIATGQVFHALGGTIEIAPFTSNGTIDLGGTSSGGTLGLPATVLAALDPAASELLIGRAHGSQAGSIVISKSVSIGNPLVALASAGDITDNATLSGGPLSTLLLAGQGGVTQASTAALDFGTLTGTATGSISLIGSNAIGTLSSLAGAGITLYNGPNLIIDGLVNAGTLIAFEGGGVTEAAGGTINANTLATTGTNVSGNLLLADNNGIGTLGGISLGGSLLLDTTIGLGIAGPVTVSSATLSAPAISITGSISTTTELSLESGSSVTETGSITAGTLDTGGTSLPGDATLTGANAIGTLGGFTLGGSLSLNDTIGLAIAGVVTTANGITLTGTSLGETGTGAIDAGTLSTSAGSFTGDVMLGNSVNSIATLGSFTALGNFYLADTGSLAITGSVAASNVSLSVPTLSLGANVQANAALGPVVAVASDSIVSTGGTLLAQLGTIEVAPHTIHGTIDLSGTSAYFDSTASEILIGSALGSQAAAINITAPATIGGTLLVLQAGSIGNASTLDATGSTLALLADTITGGTFLAPGTIEIAPSSFSTIDLGGSASAALDLAATLLAALGTSATQIFIGRALGAQAGSINIDGSVGIGGTYVVLSASNGITDTGTLSSGPAGDGILAFDGGGFVQSGATAALMAGTLQGDGNTITGPVSLTSTLNNIQTLGLISLGSFDLALTDRIPLTVIDTISAKDITLADTNGTGIILDGTLAAATGGTIDLIADALNETSGSIIAPNGLVEIAPWTPDTNIEFGGTSLAGDLTLASSLISSINSSVLQIGAIGTHAAGNIIADGTVSVPTDTLVLNSGTAGGITFTGMLGVGSLNTGLLSLASTGDITEAKTAALDIGPLTGTVAAGTIALLGTSNSIGTLSNLSAGSDITIDNGTLMLIAGLVSTPGTISLIDANFGITETGTGALDAGTLDTGATTIGGDVFLTNANSIAMLGDFAVGGTESPGGTLVLNDGLSSLQIFGLVSTGTLGRITLQDAGFGITETSGGTLAASTLDTGGTTIGGNVYLTNANSIAMLGSFAALGTIALNDAENLDIAGSVFTPKELTLENANFGITEVSGGTLDVGTLDSGGTSIGGDVYLTNANSIGTLGGFTVAGGLAPSGTLSLNDTIPLEIAGLVSASNIITLTGTSAFEDSTGTIDTPVLTTGTGSFSGDVLLTNANSIDVLSTFIAGGTLYLLDIASLTVTGPVDADSAYLTAPAITITGGIDAAHTLGLYGTQGSIIELGSVAQITADTLTGTDTAGSVALFSTLNSIGTLGSFSLASGNFGLYDLSDLIIDGSVTTPGTSSITLETAGSITEVSGGTLNTGTFTGFSGTDTGSLTSNGEVSLLNPNSIATLSNFTVTNGNFSLNNATSLDIGGSVFVSTANTITLEDANFGITEVSGGTLFAGTLNTGGTTIGGDVFLTNANSITTLGSFAQALPGTLATLGTVALNDALGLTIAGSVSTPGTLALTDAQNIVETTTGFLDIGTLTGSAAGAIVLASRNTIGMLSSLTAGSDITLNNGIDLPIDGLVISGTTLALEGAGFTEVAGGIVQAPALISVPGSRVTGSVSFDNGGNYVSGLGPFTAGSVISLVDAEPLGVGGVAAGGVFLTAPGINITGGISAYGVGLYSTAGITEPAGFINASYLTGTDRGGDVVLLGDNRITNLHGFSAPQNSFSLNDGTGLTIEGPLTASNLYANAVANVDGTVAVSNNATIINPAGGIILQGAINAGQTLSVSSTGDLSQPGGTIIAGAASLTSGGNITLSGLSSIGSELDLVAAGNITQSTTGTITAGAATFNSGGNVTLSGTSSIANQLDVVAAGNLTDPGGSITAGAGRFNSGGSIDLSGHVTIDTLLDLVAAGDVLHNSGVLDAGTLAGAAVLASFGAATDIGTLGSFILSGSTFALTNQGTLDILGPVVANVVSITASGVLTLDGSPDGGLFIKGPVPTSKFATLASGDSVLQVTNGGGGVPVIQQTGVFYIDAGPNAQAYGSPVSTFGTGLATLFLVAPPAAGDINFAAPPAGLDAPGIDVILRPGAAGTVSGNVNLLHVEIDSGTATNLTGTLSGITGPAAAAQGLAAPDPKPQYQFNYCPIAGVNCTILPIETLPATNPLQNYDLSQRKRKKLNHNIELPGIATRDF